jgi:hypothetical protein
MKHIGATISIIGLVLAGSDGGMMPTINIIGVALAATPVAIYLIKGGS